MRFATTMFYSLYLVIKEWKVDYKISFYWKKGNFSVGEKNYSLHNTT